MSRKPISEMSKAEAERALLDGGATREKKEDRFGDTKAGWWMDVVYLGKDPKDALRAVNGC